MLIVPFPESSLNEEAGRLFMENYEEYAKSARVYCNVYAKKKIQSPTTTSENQAMSMSPEKPHVEKSHADKIEPAAPVDPSKPVAKSEEVLGSLTLNPSSSEHKVAAKPGKTQSHGTVEKKKWMKRI